MTSAMQVVAVLLLGISAGVLIYRLRRRPSSGRVVDEPAKGSRIATATPFPGRREAAADNDQPSTEQELDGSDGRGDDLGEPELQAVPAGDQCKAAQGRTEESAVEEETLSVESEVVSDLEGGQAPDSQTPVSDTDSNNSAEFSASEDSPQEEKVTDGHLPTHNQAECTQEQSPPAAAVPPALDNEGKPQTDENVGSVTQTVVQGGESELGVTVDLPPVSRPQVQVKSKQTPKQYKGVRSRPPGPGNDSRGERRPTNDTEREQSLPIIVRLRFVRGGSCAVSLIPGRSPGAPEYVRVAADSGTLDLRAMQDDWYEDVTPEDVGQVLRAGVIWNQEGEIGIWTLSGRDLYVLGDRSDLSGWMSQPRLKLGRQHVILCTEQLSPAVDEALIEAGVENAEVLDASFGSPDGWVVIRDVVPVRPVSPSAEADILNALRPLPDLEICLEDGLWIRNAEWLEGFPPLIRVYGSVGESPEVQIDGCNASRGEDGAYRAPAWDAIGRHRVWCDGISKSYSVVPMEGSWKSWDAHAFPVGYRGDRHVSICGPAVGGTFAGHVDLATAVPVPESNTVILGATPGECAVALRASETHGMPCIASPSFRPVWALPPAPLLCRKRSNRILFLGDGMEAAAERSRHADSRTREAVETWAKLILDSSRKGLEIEPDSDRVRTLWRNHQRTARRIWRSGKSARTNF